VSALIGYILLFSVVLGASVVGALIGIEALATAGEPTTGEIGVQNFERLDAQITELTEGGPYRQVSFEPRDATYSYGNTYEINITASGGGVALTGSDALEFSSVGACHRILLIA
jgi:hypothetical protein